MTTISADRGRLLSTVRALWPYLWPKGRADLKARVVLASASLVLSKFILILVPFFFKWATDALSGRTVPADAFHPVALGAVMLVLAYNGARVAQAGFNQLRDTLFAAVGQHAVKDISMLTFRHLHALSLRFHLERRTGGLTRAIERGTKGIETIVRFVILNSLPTLIELMLTAAVLVWFYGLPALLIATSMVVAYVGFTIKASDWRIDVRRAMNAADAEANQRAVDSLLNFETVKVFANEALEAERFGTSVSTYERLATKVATSQGLLNFGQVVIFSAGMAAMMLLTVSEIAAGRQSVGDFVFVNALLMQLALPLGVIAFVYSEVRQGIANLEALFELLGTAPEITDRADARPLAVTEARVSFRDVHFAYDPRRPILRGISFDIAPGATVAVVGPSGAGKSTLSRLLYRFYDVTGGSVEIDGQDVRAVTQGSLRQAIGMVPQDTVLFNETLAYNIRYGRPDADDAEVEAAALTAQLGPFLATQPDGLKALVGERGLKLSGGEKQRVAIARTLLKAPPILVLDEATSALDTKTEQEIQSAFDRVSKGRTTLVIAHRLSTIVDADEIIVLKDGLIAERGRHADLVALGGVYAGMWALQRETAEAEATLARLRQGQHLA